MNDVNCKLNETDIITYSSFLQIVDSFQHYNRIQVAYRSFASTWLLATYIGIGYSLSAHEISLPLQPFVTVSLISIASTLGLFLITSVMGFNKLVKSFYKTLNSVFSFGDNKQLNRTINLLKN